MSTLAIMADAYAALGWATLPVGPSRGPLSPGGVYGASLGSGWCKVHPDANLGVSIGTTGCIVIDEDPRAGGHQALEALFSTHGAFPRTPQSVTARGGRHWYFRHPVLPAGTKLRGRLAQGVDCLGGGKYAIEFPSRTEHGGYMWVESPWSCDVVDPPDWLVHSLRVNEYTQQHVAPVSAGTGMSMQAAVIWLEKAPRAVAGSNGSATTMKVVSVVTRYFELGADAAYDALSDWNASCEPPWSERELRRKIDQVERYSTFRPAMTYAQRCALNNKL